LNLNLSLRTRLFLTYLFLLAVTVGVIAGAFVLLLNTRQAPPQQTYQRLAAVAQGVPLGQILVEVTSELPRTRAEMALALENALINVAQERNVRILLLNIRTGAVVFDSAETLQPGTPLLIDTEAYTIPAAIQRGFPSRVNAIFGRFEDPSGEWLFVGLLANQPLRQTSVALLFADPPDNTSLQQALADFSGALALPLCQSAVVGLLVALALATIGSRSVALPLQHLARASADVAKGNYEQRVPVIGPPEVRAVADRFNYMTSQVQRTQQAQQDFLANVSHDLKTPLTSIQGYAQAIVDGAAADPVQAASIIYEEASRLNRMVAELTDLARLQAGRMSIQLQPVDISQIITAVGERLSIVAREKGVQLTVYAPPMPEVNGDGDRLAQVLTNLISNAIKYTPSGGWVSVKAQVADSGVEIIVQDNGIGIPPQELPRIFERFYQVDKARGPERGTGLGLAIAREIAQAHGGRIDVVSAGRGKGATFTLWLPVTAPNGSSARH